MILAAAYMTKSRKAKEMMTEGVIVMIAATKKLKAECIVDGSVERACIRVEYDAMIMGGNGGKSGSSEDVGSIGFDGW